MIVFLAQDRSWMRQELPSPIRAKVDEMIWLLVAASVVGVAGALFVLARRRDDQSDFGSVSNQWLSEQRLGQSNDPHR